MTLFTSAAVTTTSRARCSCATFTQTLSDSICWEANVITLNNTNVFASKNIANIPTGFANGWLAFARNPLGYATELGAAWPALVKMGPTWDRHSEEWVMHFAFRPDKATPGEPEPWSKPYVAGGPLAMAELAERAGRGDEAGQCGDGPGTPLRVGGCREYEQPSAAATAPFSSGWPRRSRTGVRMIPAFTSRATSD